MPSEEPKKNRQRLLRTPCLKYHTMIPCISVTTHAHGSGRKKISLGHKNGKHAVKGFEPPHIHVSVDNQDIYGIDLVSESFIESPPSSTYRDIMTGCRENSQVIGEIRGTIHGE